MTTLMMTYLKIHLIVYRQSYSTSLSIIFLPSPIYLYYKRENYYLYINYVANFAQQISYFQIDEPSIVNKTSIGRVILKKGLGV
jgi:hypothetical protein